MSNKLTVNGKEYTNRKQQENKMKTRELVKLMKEENISVPVQGMTNKQFKAMMKRSDVKLDDRKDNFIVVKND